MNYRAIEGKKWKVILGIVVLLCQIALLLAACGQTSTPTPAPKPALTPTPTSTPTAAPTPTSAKPIELIFAHAYPPTHYMGITNQTLADTVKERSGGRLILKVYPSAQLVKADGAVDAVSTGRVDIVSTTATYYSDINPYLSMFELGYLFSDIDHMLRTLDGGLSALVDEGWGKVNLVPLARVDICDYKLLSRSKEIKAPADLKGTIVRPAGAWSGKIMVSLGASTSFLPATEVYLALQRGVMDVTYAPLVSIYDYKWYEVAKSMTWLDLMVADVPLLINKDKWNALPADLRSILKSSGEQTMRATTTGLYPARQVTAEKTVKDAGMKIYYPTAAEKDEWIKAGRLFWSDWAKSVPRGAEALALVEKFRTK